MTFSLAIAVLFLKLPNNTTETLKIAINSVSEQSANSALDERENLVLCAQPGGFCLRVENAIFVSIYRWCLF